MPSSRADGRRARARASRARRASQWSVRHCSPDSSTWPPGSSVIDAPAAAQRDDAPVLLLRLPAEALRELAQQRLDAARARERRRRARARDRRRPSRTRCRSSSARAACRRGGTARPAGRRSRSGAASPLARKSVMARRTLAGCGCRRKAHGSDAAPGPGVIRAARARRSAELALRRSLVAGEVGGTAARAVRAEGAGSGHQASTQQFARADGGAVRPVELRDLVQQLGRPDPVGRWCRPSSSGSRKRSASSTSLSPCRAAK